MASLLDLIIRASRPGDSEGIAALHNGPQYRWGTLRQPFHSPEEIRKRIESQTPGNLWLVAVLGDRIVGDIGLWRMQGRRSHVGEIGMGVHDDFHGRGIGTALMAAVIDTADNWLGLTRLQLTVHVDNERAIALYRRHGFEIEGRHRGYTLRNGELIDAFSMARLRDPPRLASPVEP